jgi:hypothetical protein
MAEQNKAAIEAYNRHVEKHGLFSRPLPHFHARRLMAHLDVYRNPDRTTSALIPYVLDVQSSLLDSLPGSVVIPLAAPKR